MVFLLKESVLRSISVLKTGIADTIKPCLQQAGADCERVAYIIDNDIALTLEDGRIETAIKDTHASVFIIDPIQAFIPPDADMQSATKMRSVLRKLAYFVWP